MVSRHMTGAGGTFNVQGPDAQAMKETIEDHEGRLDTVEDALAGTTTITHILRLPLSDLRVFDAVKDALPDAAGSDDLGLADAAGSVLLSGAINGAAVTQKAGVEVMIPWDYKAGGTLTLRLRAKRSGAAQVSTTIDAEVKVKDGDGALGSDICATAAQSITGTDAYADYDFTITPTSRVPGEILNIVLVLAGDDTGGTNNRTLRCCDVSLRYQGRVAA